MPVGEEETMAALLRRLPALAGLAVLAAACAEAAGHRAFTGRHYDTTPALEQEAR